MSIATVVKYPKRHKGTVTIRKDMACPHWYGRWSVYTPLTDGRFRSKRRSAILGPVSEMTREQAQSEVTRRMMLSQTKFGGWAVAKHSKKQQWFASNPLVRGAVAELIAAADLMCSGAEVFMNMNPTGTCDLIVYDAPRGFIRLEVKSGTVSPVDTPLVEVRKKRGKFDALAVVLPDGSVRYFDAEMHPLPALVSGRTLTKDAEVSA